MNMTKTLATEKLAQQKLEAFERLQSEFEASFHFVQEVHGQRRFSSFPVMESVHYLHSLWICECKDRLPSIYKNIERFEGSYCLDLLQRWQEGDTADVIAFLHAKLDGFPFVELTYQIIDAKTTRPEDDGLVRRLTHGRQTLLNRSMNLMQAFAMHTIEGYLELVSPSHNNIKGERIVDHPEIDRDGFRV